MLLFYKIDINLFNLILVSTYFIKYLILFDVIFISSFEKIQFIYNMKKLQIGIMGSAADLNYSDDALQFAKQLGRLVAESGNILVYGAEKEYSSLSTNAAIEAHKYGGLTVGVIPGKNKEIYGDFRPDVLITTGLEIGGGREFSLVLSCDVIIAISGGSGTLTEMAIAYQAGIPIITVSNFGGWAKQVSNTFIDDRKRLKCIEVTTPEQAIKEALKAAKEKNDHK